VLPRFFNKAYLEFTVGMHFGEADLGQDRALLEALKNDKSNGFFDKDKLIRRFTVLAMSTCDFLTLSIKDLMKMKLEFPKIFMSIF
jgi:hypothetical protein